MSDLLADFDLDRISFWIGFLAGSLFWGFLILIRPLFTRLLANLRARSQALRQEMTSGIDIRLNNDTLQHIQQLHIANRLFALDEILITPRLLAPPPQVLPEENPPAEDIITEILPYTPDWPELAVLYGVPTLTLAEAFQETSRLVLMGRPGSGKTVAMAQLAASMIRKEKLPCDLNHRTPIFIHVGDLSLPVKNPENLLETIFDALTPYSSPLTSPRLLSHLDRLFQGDQGLLLIDGLDELPPKNIDDIVQFLGDLLNKYPSTRVVITASLDYYGRITNLDFAPLAIASWDENQRAEFIRKWSQQWEKYVGPNYEGPERTDPLLLNAWLLQDRHPFSPLELTLKVWSTYAGDSLGPKSVHSLEAYLRRMTVDISNGRLALERIALGIIKSDKPIFNLQDIDMWLSESNLDPGKKDETRSQAEELNNQEIPGGPRPSTAITSRILPDLYNNGLLYRRRDGYYQFVHSQILSFLAGKSLESELGRSLIEKRNWPSSVQAIGYAAIEGNIESLITLYLQNDTAPDHRLLFHAALWLRDTEKKASWRVNVVRELVTLVRDNRTPIGIRLRGAAALASSEVQGIESLFQQLITASDAELRLIAVLSGGLLGDPSLTENIAQLINDPVISVRRAACYCLVAIGTQAALETTADVLLSGEEDLRRAAAEALANHREEGYPTLKEGATLDDILVRRAVIYGLRRIKQPWASQLLEQIQIEDSQWAVKNIAGQALDEINRPNPRLPRRFPALTETPWLIAFAGERGIGVSPGKPARALLIQALNEGKPEQRLAVLDYLLRHAGQEDLPAIVQLIDSAPNEIRDSAYNALWHLGLSGLIPLNPEST